MHDLLHGMPTTLGGYDIAAEKQRYDYPNISGCGLTLNRGTARISVSGDMDPPAHAKIRERHLRSIFTTTHSADSPVVEFGYPTAGPYVASPAGTYFDLQLGVAQKLLCDHHPAFVRAIDALIRHRLIWRREINTDDFFEMAPQLKGEVHTPQELAEQFASLAKEAFPIVPGYKVFFSNSGTEAIEAGIKLAQLVRYRKLVERHGMDTVHELMRQLEIPRHEALEAKDRSWNETIYRDYPMFLFAFESAFHGRTMGSLSLTASKKRQALGYQKLRWVKHFTWNEAAKELEAMLDPRELPAILAAEGGVKKVLAAGRVPKDLAAAFVAEAFQGEGGYRIADRRAIQDLGAILKRHGILFMIDEVQSFGRTGTAFFSQQLLNEPDIIATAKGAVVGVTLGRAEYEQYLHGGWHSNTWGGGKLFDNELAYATVDALRSYRDPIFDGLPYTDNCRVKGQYLDVLVQRLQERHPEVLVGHGGAGLMHGIRVRWRDDVTAEAWRRGVKLLGCGLPGEVAAIRLLFLADTTARELEDFAVSMDGVLAAVKARKLAAKTPAGAGV